VDGTTPIRFLADENLNGDIVRGLRRRRPELSVDRVEFLPL